MLREFHFVMTDYFESKGIFRSQKECITGYNSLRDTDPNTYMFTDFNEALKEYNSFKVGACEMSGYNLYKIKELNSFYVDDDFLNEACFATVGETREGFDWSDKDLVWWLIQENLILFKQEQELEYGYFENEEDENEDI